MTGPRRPPDLDLMLTLWKHAREHPRSDWRKDAACGPDDHKLFFPDNYDPIGPALAICEMCEVRAWCLDYAMVNRMEYGVWGGASERARRRLRHYYLLGLAS